MATQTRRTTRRSARYFRATVKASMVTACCGFILMSAVAAHAAAPWNGMPFNGIPFNGMPWNGLPWNGMPYNGMPFNGMPFQGLPWNGLPVNGTLLQGLPAQEGSLSMAPHERLPWSTLSHRALGQAAAPAMHDNRDTLPVELPEVR